MCACECVRVLMFWSFCAGAAPKTVASAQGQGAALAARHHPCDSSVEEKPSETYTRCAPTWQTGAALKDDFVCKRASVFTEEKGVEKRCM